MRFVCFFILDTISVVCLSLDRSCNLSGFASHVVPSAMLLEGALGAERMTGVGCNDSD